MYRVFVLRQQMSVDHIEYGTIRKRPRSSSPTPLEGTPHRNREASRVDRRCRHNLVVAAKEPGDLADSVSWDPALHIEYFFLFYQAIDALDHGYVVSPCVDDELINPRYPVRLAKFKEINGRGLKDTHALIAGIETPLA